jgi:predicted XRE-type DNA-binding protein
MDIDITTRSIFDQLGRDRAEAETLKIRARLMDRLIAYIEENTLTQTRAGELMGVSQPRISDLVQGKISRFSVDMLLSMAFRAGLDVSIEITGTTRGKPAAAGGKRTGTSRRTSARSASS